MIDPGLLQRIEAYLDAAPRTAAVAEEVGKFTLFQPLGPWPFYARPRLGLTEPVSALDVDTVRARQRALKLPESFEWVVENAPTLMAAALAAGLETHEYPLMVLGDEGLRAAALPAGMEIRFIDADDPDFARAHAVASVGFAAGGTMSGPEGGAERDASAAVDRTRVNEFMRDRARSGLSVSAAAFDRDGPLAVGTHQPVGDVTEIVGVATLPAARRRGLGAAVTAALVEDALARGVETVLLSAGSDDVARVYARIGFRRIGSAGAAELADASAPGQERIDVDPAAG